MDEYLQTSVPRIYAAGDIARWPARLSGERIRVEHGVVGERQGQTAARNMLRRRERFDAVPFFWTEQYDFGLAYDGHAERFDMWEIDGALDARDCTISYRSGGRKLATSVIHRDLEGLRAEVEFERAMARAWVVDVSGQEQSMSVTRRDVGKALAAGAVLLWVQGCGGGGGDATAPRSAGCGAGDADISLNHGHVLVIVSSDLDSMVDMTYSIRGSSDHDHTVTLSVSQLQQLKAGASVTATASASAAHSHVVTVTC